MTVAVEGRRLPEVAADLDPRSPSELVTRALAGDRSAWEGIVARYQGVAWRVVGTFDLSVEDRNDVFASAFFRLFERLETIREPEKLPGWIATTTRNEALTLLRSRRRERPIDLTHVEGGGTGSSDDGLLDAELRAAVRRAFAALPPECRALLALVTADPPLSYDEVASLTGRPRGSIGPTRQRCLDRLRRSPELAPFIDEHAS